MKGEDILVLMTSSGRPTTIDSFATIAMVKQLTIFVAKPLMLDVCASSGENSAYI